VSFINSNKNKPLKQKNSVYNRSIVKAKRNIHIRKKICRFCTDKLEIDYKNINLICTFVTEKGRIFSGRVTGTCAKHQRKLSKAIKRARILALLPFKSN
jgi:small subunit ribosomal protein S18